MERISPLENTRWFRDPENLRSAACRRKGPEDTAWNPDLFFPTSETEPYQAQIEEAKAICRECPIIVGCLQWAISHKEFGIWGGTTKKERDAFKSRKNANTR